VCVCERERDISSLRVKTLKIFSKWSEFESRRLEEICVVAVQLRRTRLKYFFFVSSRNFGVFHKLQFHNARLLCGVSWVMVFVLVTPHTDTSKHRVHTTQEHDAVKPQCMQNSDYDGVRKHVEKRTSQRKVQKLLKAAIHSFQKRHTEHTKT
jgi:hypothetical protein